MLLQPLVYFAAVIWAICFVAFGLYIAFRRATPSFSDRAVGLVVSILVAGIGSGAMVGVMYLVEEVF